MREHVERTRQHGVGPIKVAVKDKATGPPPDDFFTSLFGFGILNSELLWSLDRIPRFVYGKLMLKAAFPGSFDPPTLGHVNIIERAARIFDEVLVVVAENRQKKYLFPVEERIAMVSSLVEPWKNVSVAQCDSLIVDFIQKRNIRLLLRGVRDVGDFSYEFELSMMNKALGSAIETIFMTTDPEYFVLRSSAIKELASFHGDVSSMVPPLVAEALRAKYP
jgi:pantetheine-phosphate adenylyltransferase